MSIEAEDDDEPLSPLKNKNEYNNGKEELIAPNLSINIESSAVEIKEKTNADIKIQKSNGETEEKQYQEELVKKYEGSIFGRVFSYSSHRKGLFAIGILVSICNGMVFPIFGVFVGKIVAILVSFKQDPIQARHDANLYSLIFVIIGISSFILNIFQQIIFITIGEETTEKIRNETYHKILKMPIAWLDLPRNNAGSLSAKLASDCQTVNGLTTTYTSVMIQNITVLAAGIIIALVY